ncbi:hypothetical protein ACLUS7_16065 [Enterobacterales bacterium BD_CKDN230030183-1A_HGKHYDSX7]
MKYLSVIYYDTFARFFCAIEDAVKAHDASASFLHLAIFPSGWLYMKAQGRNVRLLPWQVRKSHSRSPLSVHMLDKISHYHAVAGERHGEGYSDILRCRAQAYVSTMAAIVQEFEPDAVLFSGDTRIACEALQHYLNESEHPAKRFYFEQGPNGTTIFDKKGVNANCSFREPAASLMGDGYNPAVKVKQQRFRRNPFYRGCDYALISALRVIGRVPPEWDTMSLERLPKKAYERCISLGRKNSCPGKAEVLVALQVPDDANNIHHNPLGLADAELVRWVLRASHEAGLLVRVREHPLYRRRYSAEMYKILAESERTILSDSTLDEDLISARVVVTINSMTGLDAYLREVPVVTLGNSFYDHLPGIERVRDEGHLEAVLKELLENGLTQKLAGLRPASIFAEMCEKNFIIGHYLDEHLVAPRAIAEILANELKLNEVTSDEP